MKTKKLLKIKTKTVLAVAGITLGWICWNPGSACYAQTQPDTQTSSANLPAGVNDIVKLSRAGLSEDVILTKVKADGLFFNLSADQLIYLQNQGVSGNVIHTMQSGPGSAPPPVVVNNSAPQSPPPAEPPPVVSNDSPGAANPNSSPDTAGDNNPQPKANFDSFHEQLSPYGNWIQTPDGPVWQPNVTAGWRPYYDGGHWVNTDAGWYWQSDYTWGDVAFHYGRWSYSPSYGWTWAPAYEFAPAWVCWRHADDDGYCGWAPLPPGAVFVDGGWMFHGARVAVDFDFGLTAGLFTFVAYDHFWEHDFRLFIVPHDRLAFIYRRSVFENHYRFDHGRFVNEGLARDRMAHLTGREVRVESAHAIRTQEAHDHILQRQNDREIVKTGGRIDATKRIESSRNIAARDPNIKSGRNTPDNVSRAEPRNTSRTPFEDSSKISRGNPSGNTLNNTTGRPSVNPNVNGHSASETPPGSQINQSTQSQGGKDKQKDKQKDKKDKQ